MPPTIRLQKHAQKLLDHVDLDIVDRYRAYLLESPERHLYVGKVLIDVDQVVRRRFTCDTHLCLKHGKEPGKFKSRYSCCVDLTVQLLPTEIENIERHLARVIAGHPDVAQHVVRHGFWKYDEDWWKILQKKKGKTGGCAFLTWSEEMQMQVCSLHATALREGIPMGEIKPLICRMFPLFLMENGDGKHLITCYGPHTHRLLFEEEEYVQMNCLHENPRATDQVFRVLKGALTTLLSEDGYRQLTEAAERILARDAAREAVKGNGRQENGRKRR